VRIAALVLCLTALAGEARAEWFLGAFTGASHTASNTLSVSGPATQVAIGPVDYRSEPFISPIYYGVSVGWTPAGRRLGVEGEWTHTKARATAGSELLTRFDQSHGLNFVLASAVYRHPLAGGRVRLLARAGGGFTLPHVEGTFEGNHTESYQYGGLAWQAGAGVEVALWRGVSALAGGRFTRTAEELEVGSVLVDGTFNTAHVDFGIGWRFGR
jgi:opacity protein-like surface antigen